MDFGAVFCHSGFCCNHVLYMQGIWTHSLPVVTRDNVPLLKKVLLGPLTGTRFLASSENVLFSQKKKFSDVKLIKIKKQKLLKRHSRKKNFFFYCNISFSTDRFKVSNHKSKLPILHDHFKVFLISYFSEQIHVQEQLKVTRKNSNKNSYPRCNHLHWTLFIFQNVLPPWCSSELQRSNVDWSSS